MNGLFFLHRMEGPFRVAMRFSCSKKVTKNDQNCATEHNEVGFQKTLKMPLFAISLFLRKKPFERDRSQKMIKKHRKKCKITFWKPFWRPNSGPFRWIWSDFCADTRTQRTTLKNEGFAPPSRPVLRDFWGSLFGSAVLGFRESCRVFLGFLHFWKTRKKSLFKKRGWQRDRSLKWEGQKWKRRHATYYLPWSVH